LRVVPDPAAEGPHQYVLVQVKGSLAAAVSLAYRTAKRGDAITIEWGGVSSYTAEDVAGGGRGDRSRGREAEHVLYSILAAGPVWVKEVLKLAAEAGVARRTLDRAKSNLKIRAWKQGGGQGARWMWQLPDDEDLLRPFRQRDLDELSDRLFHGGDEPPLPGEGWKEAGDDEDDDEPIRPRP
jgi:hypothetical protein